MARAGPLFLSYSSHDRETACAVEAVLTAEPIGRSVWRDERSIERDWSREIAGALAGADAIVSVWSANAAASHWVRHEWLTARALGKPIMPVLTDQTPLPPPLENLQAVTASDGRLDAAAAAKRLAAVLAVRPEYDFTIRPRGLSIPLAPNTNFVGREDDLLDLYLALIGQFNRIGTRAVGAVGMGGVGKTQLAVEFVYRFAFAFGGVHWINAAHADEWTERFVSLARDDLRLQPDGDAEPTDQEWIRLLRAHCADHPDLLLVMDNVEDPEQLAEAGLLGLAPLDLGCSLLFTTRRRFELPGVASHTVAILGERAAYELLTARRPPHGHDEEEHARAICAALGFLPLALVLASAYLARYTDVTFGDYRRALADNRLDTVDVQGLSSAKLATRHEAAVRHTLDSQSQALTDPAARLLFQLAGLMRPGELIPIGRLGLLAGLHQQPGALARPLDDARLELEDLSLAEPAEGGRALRLHPLVHDFARGLVDDPDAARAAAAKRLADAYGDAGLLEREYAQRGPDGVIGDVALALDWSPPADARGSLDALAEILDAESSALNRFPHDRYPALFLQQLANRAAIVGADDLADSARARLRAAGRAHFVHRWRTQGASPELMRTIVGPRSWMTAAAIAPSGRLLVTVAEESGSESPGQIGVWDLATGRHIEDVDAQEKITGLVFPGDDDDHVLTTGNSGELRLWHLPTGRVERSAAGGGDGLAALALTPDRRTALTRGAQKALLAWDLASWSAPRVVGTTGNGADVIAATPDGTHALVGSYGAPPGGSFRDDRGRLELWSLETGERLREVEAHSFVIDVVLVAGGSVLTAGRDGFLRLWALDTLEPQGQLDVGEPSAGTVLADGRAAIAARRDVAIVDLQELSVVRTLRGHTGYLRSIAASPDGTRLVSAGADGTARVWRLDRADAGTRRRPGHEAAVRDGLALEDAIVTGDMDGVLKLWARETGELLAEHKQWMGKRDNAVAARGGRIVLTSSADLEGGSILALDVAERTERHVMGTDGRVPFLRLDRGEQLLVVGDRTALTIYDAAAIDNLLGTRRQTLKPPPGDESFDAAAMTPDGTLLAAATSAVFGGNDTLVLFDAASGAVLAHTERVEGNVGQMAITEDGTRVVFSTGSGVLGVWEPFGGGPPRVLARGLGSSPKLLELGAGRFVTAGDEVCLWVPGRDEPQCRLGGHPGTWHLERAGADRVLTASDDWTVSLWDLEAGTEVAMLALDGGASLATLSADARAFLCGDEGGDVYVFELLLPDGL